MICCYVALISPMIYAMLCAMIGAIICAMIRAMICAMFMNLSKVFNAINHDLMIA